MKRTFVAAFALLFSSVLFAQKNTVGRHPGRTQFYAEVGGPGILFSANIDTRFTPSSLGWGGRFGLGFYTGDEYNYYGGIYGNYYTQSVVTVPVQVNYIFGKTDSPHTFEVGGGLTYAGKKIDIMNYNDSSRTNLFGTASFMYRRQPLKGGFTWRIGFTPIIAKGYIMPSGGASVGYSF
ncbi:MAG: hypothetical protein HZA79_14965 [Sphingobacteriales bacterium]|nr:hypothetical protein [Sphingobacteriales bacterium]